MSFAWRDVPVYVNCRDRVTDLRALVTWLEQASYERIVLLDNASTYPPLLEFYERTAHEVVMLEENLGKLALWRSGRVPDEWFVHTDPDVVPIEACPHDAVSHLHRLLMRHRRFDKAALGLYLDDVPAKMKSLGWERELVHPSRQLARGVFDSAADTTFALYRPCAQFSMRALRVGHPYQCRHLPWYYADGRELSEEDRYFLEHVPEPLRGPLGSSWAQGRQV
jgi:hypothetical protein